MRSVLWLLGALVPFSAAAERPVIDATYLYELADFSGPLTSNRAQLAYDPEAREVLVVQGEDRSVRIFGPSGMELYRFGEDLALGGVIKSVAPLPNGDMIALLHGTSGAELLRLNFRGEVQSHLSLGGLPSTQMPFRPNKVVYAHGELHLMDLCTLQAVALNPSGELVRRHDLGALLGLSPEDRENTCAHDFTADEDGFLLVTLPTLFRVFAVSPNGEVRSFGGKGGAPGRFNIVSGVTTDEQGRIFVSDVLRSVVMVFDRDFAFGGEFGYQGTDAGHLVGPTSIAAGHGKVFVSQSRQQGVSVFEVRVRILPDEVSRRKQRGSGTSRLDSRLRKVPMALDGPAPSPGARPIIER